MILENTAVSRGREKHATSGVFLFVRRERNVVEFSG
jgi:hypothetical protein